MPNISLILITKNESERLKKWSTWLPKLTNINELIVVDDSSTDNTLEIAKKLSSKTLVVKTFSRGLDNNFSAQRQFALSKTTNDWVLWLDPDEQPTDTLITYINDIDAALYNFSFKRSDVFLGHKLKHGETSSQYFLRLFNKNFGKFSGLVHEVWSSTKPIQNIELEIIHQSHQNLKSFFEKTNFYSDIRSKELFERGVRTNLFQIICYPKAKFIQNYFFRLGFLDGTPGIIFALGMSFHSFLVRSKLWTLQNP
jgi:glycosyltransferase involved in cell wall biosynthesis